MMPIRRQSPKGSGEIVKAGFNVSRDSTSQKLTQFDISSAAVAILTLSACHSLLGPSTPTSRAAFRPGKTCSDASPAGFIYQTA
jgi:hypothetical protein